MMCRDSVIKLINPVSLPEAILPRPHASEGQSLSRPSALRGPGRPGRGLCVCTGGLRSGCRALMLVCPTGLPSETPHRRQHGIQTDAPSPCTRRGRRAGLRRVQGPAGGGWGCKTDKTQENDVAKHTLAG